MTSTFFSRPDRAIRIVLAASIAIFALALTACGDAQPQERATP